MSDASAATTSPVDVHAAYVERLVDLMPPGGNVLLGASDDDLRNALAAGDLEPLRRLRGQWAGLAKVGNVVRMARSIGRPMRFFLAKRTEGPCLVVAERIDAIRDWLRAEGLGDQFHPSYTRMVPAHYLTELRLIGCPDPSPTLTRYFTPERNAAPADVAECGRRYIGALADTLSAWLDWADRRFGIDEPLGVLFSGGIDSGAVLLVTEHLLRARGQSPARLKAFTLAVDGRSPDAEQAFAFLDAVDLTMLLEVVDVPAAAISPRRAVAVTEDYKPLDIQAAAMGIALLEAVRGQSPDWRLLLDGDGGDENLKDYPIEANPELTIRSVLNNPLLYHEGWGVHAVKHSQTYSGGQSRGHVRTAAPARLFGFEGFSPFATPAVIEQAEAIPFIELTEWDHDRLYRLKGEVVRAGVEAVTGRTMPIFEKRRFQDGATQHPLVPDDEPAFRGYLREHLAAASAS